MTASLNSLEENNNHQYSKVEDIKNNIITDPNLIPNGLRQEANHNEVANNNRAPNTNQVPHNNKTQNTNQPQEDNRVPNTNQAQEEVVVKSLEDKINQKLSEAIENKNRNNEIDRVIELSKKKTNTYAADLLSKYTKNKNKASNNTVKKLNNGVNKKCNFMSDLMKLFPLSIIILLLVFIILLIVCMQA